MRNKLLLKVGLLFAAIFALICVAWFNSGIVSAIYIFIGLIGILYYFIVLQLMYSTTQPTILCDGRFYVFSAIALYSIIPPLYGVLTIEQNNGVRMRSTYTALTYLPKELLLTLIMSLLFFAGILLGLMLRNKTSRKQSSIGEMDNGLCEKKFRCWFLVCAISTLIFLLPFIRGGFRVILAGGTIDDVNREHEWSIIWKVLDVFFSAEMMTASTVAVLYYWSRKQTKTKKKSAFLFSIVILEALLAYLTTRRARAISIILCAFIIYIYRYVSEKKRLPIGRLAIAGGVFVFFYMLEIIMGQITTGGTFAELLHIFDGVYAYDSLLLATRNTPSVTMLGNVVYGVFRHIPILGKYFIQLLGFKNDVAPLYQWMAERYVTYQYGGGLAYTPQLEAYLSLGYIGCLLFGFIYGYVFGKKREGLPNLFVAAMAFSIARGNLQIVLSLMWPFGIIGYYFYDQFLFSRVTVGKQKAYSSNSSSHQGDLRNG